MSMPKIIRIIPARLRTIAPKLPIHSTNSLLALINDYIQKFNR